MERNDVKNIKWGVVLSYVSLLVGLLGTLFVTNRVLDYIGDYNYGLYSFVNSITAWITILVSALSASYLRFASIEALDNNSVSKTNTLYFKFLVVACLSITIFGCGTIGVLSLLKVNIGSYSETDSQLMYALFIFSIINIAITFPSSIFSLFITYKKRFIFEKSIAVILEIVKYAGYFLVSFFTKSIVALSLFSIFTTLLTFFANFIYSEKALGISFARTSFRENKALVGSIIAFSSILIINSVVDQINTNVDKTLLGFFSIPENVTIYQLGQHFSSYLSIASIAVSGVFSPRIHELCANKKTEAVNELFVRVSRMQAMIVCFISFGFVSCGMDFVKWWVGPSRINVYYVGTILMLLSIMPLSVKLSIEVQRAYNKHKFRSLLYLAVSIMNIGISIVCLIFLSSEYAIFACLIGTVVSSIACHWIGINIYNEKRMLLPMKKHYLNLIKYVLFGLIATSFSMTIKYVIINKFESYFLKMLIEGLSYVSIFCGLILLLDRKFIKYTFRKINGK